MSDSIYCQQDISSYQSDKFKREKATAWCNCDELSKIKVGHKSRNSAIKNEMFETKVKGDDQCFYCSHYVLYSVRNPSSVNQSRGWEQRKALGKVRKAGGKYAAK